MGNERLILCGGIEGPSQWSDLKVPLRLQISGENPNVRLKIKDINDRFATNIKEVFIDLLEIASYVYCADQVVTRGGKTDPNMGENWRRRLRFHIPVRRPDVWESPEVCQSLVSTLDFLSDDYYSFNFKKLDKPPRFEQYLEGMGDATLEPESIVLFSGGLDSLAGAVQEAVIEKKQVILVSHRSAQTIHSKQLNLIKALASHCSGPSPIHVPVWATKIGDYGRVTTQRSRSFLYAALGATVAHLFDIPALRMYENGVVSMNLPISEQLIGARATRTTHPRVLKGFTKLFSLIMDKPFKVENPLLWETRAEVVARIAEAGCPDLIEDSVSCSHVRMNRCPNHCGKCSQCIGRRFAVLASGNAPYEPQEIYEVDLLTGAREKPEDKTMLESYARTATLVTKMNDIEFFSNFGEASRVSSYLDGASDEIGARIFDLHKRHAEQVCRVIDNGIKSHVREIREGTLPESCLLILALPENYRNLGEVSMPERISGKNIFLKKGQFWKIVFEGKEIILKNTKGVRYLALLIKYPDHKFHVTTMIQEPKGNEIYNVLAEKQLSQEGLSISGIGNAGEILDSKAAGALKKQIKEIEEEIREAQDKYPDTVEKLRESKEFLEEQLLSGIGLMGRRRKFSDPSEKARISVTNRIREIQEIIKKEHPALGQHLINSIKTGFSCSYTPDKPTPWET
ncbi:MAG: 7-cyano-7-deazaguanine synthase [Thermodesulfobacteriota bacterium]